MKKQFVLFLTILLILPLSGCWNRREIGKIAIVMGFAVDKGEEDEIDITAQIANTRTIAASENSGKGGEAKPYLNLTSRGEYIFPSIRSSVTKSGAKLYMAHNYVVLFGEELAKSGLGNYMDFFLRDHELRLDMHLLVAQGRAADVLDVNAGFQSIPALHINDLIKAQKQLSTGMTVTVFDFMNQLTLERTAPKIPIIEIDDSSENKVLRMSGTAVFQKDKMVGKLNEKETRGYLWAANAAREAVVVAHPDGDSIGIEVVRANGKITAETDDKGQVTMVIRTEAEGSLGSQRGNRNYTTKEGLDTLLTAFAGEIESEIQACLKKSRALHADVFGFGDVLYRHYPDLWEKLQNREMYNLPVRIEVKTRLDSSGRIGAPVE